MVQYGNEDEDAGTLGNQSFETSEAITSLRCKHSFRSSSFAEQNEVGTSIYLTLAQL